MKPPRNIELPFFTYGLFKPGQLCFFRIKEFTKEEQIGSGLAMTYFSGMIACC